MGSPDRPAPWYRDGLRFECSRCGDCCRGPGYVWVDGAEIDRIQEHLRIPDEELGRRYLRRVGNRVALTDNARGDCIFWEDGCTIYPARPNQCRTFPFWPQNLATPQEWEETVSRCPGAGEGRLYSLGEIDELQRGRGATEAPDDPATTR